MHDVNANAVLLPRILRNPRWSSSPKHYAKGGMTEVGLGVGSGGGGGGGVGRGLVHTPDSDCNSNHPRSASVLSNTSSQDIDFIQDNSDYQWFLDYGYRDNHHTSILSLPESYEAADIGYYDTLAKNLDANLAEADIESFRTEDIHALLTNLPPMCSDQSSQDSNREGESYASVSNSMLGKFDFDSSSPHSSSQGEEDSTSMSICKSELLFSPVKESMPMLPMPNFSVDSLDCDLLNEHDIMLTCQANKDNYTIAFEGSVTMYSEDSDYHEADKSETSGGDGSAHWRPEMLKEPMQPALNPQQESMTQSDSSSFTTWSKLKKRCSDQQLRRLPSGNNNQSGDELTNSFLDADPAAKSRSMPNLYKQKLRGLVAHNYQARSNQLSNSSVECCTTIKRRPVKVFDIQHQSSSGESGSLVSDMATSADQNTTSSSKQHPQNFNLVKLFMKQKSISAEGMSTGLDQSSDWSGESSAQNQKLDDSKGSLNNNGHDLEVKRRVMRTRSTNTRNSRNVGLSSSSSTASSFTKSKHVPMHLMNKSIQTSECKESKIKVVPPSFLNKLKKEGEIQKPVYVCYPNYVLPNLDFLNETTDKVVFVPQKVSASKALNRTGKRPFSCSDVEALKKKGFSHVQDWDSLNFLLPNECKKILADVPEVAHYGQSKEKPSFKKSSDFSDDVSSSSGYRGSSSLLAEEQQQLQQQQQQQQFNPLFVYRYDSATSSAASSAPPLPKRSISLDAPPRPPLPRGILRKDRQEEEPFKLRRKKLSETEDEGFDASTSSVESVLFSKEELNQLEEFLKMSAVSSDHDDMNDESMLQLRSCVSKFLALKINQDRKCVSFAGNVKNVAPNNSPNVSALLTQRFTQGKTLVEMPICEEAESSEFSPQRKTKNPKCSLISDVCDSVGKIVQGFSSATDQGELKVLCDSTMNPRSAKLVLNTLCPALYAVLSDGLKPSLETSFGAIGNSVWQVVEASAQQGPLTKALNELVMRINSEDVITEGVVKFNALVFGLLNVRSLDAWFSYLRTRESILRKHYAPDSLLVQSHTGGTETRALLDTLITSLQPLALFPFQFDLLFEYRLLHESLKRMDSYQQPPSPSHKVKSVEDVLPDLLSTSPPKPAVRLSKQRPRSCVDPKPAFKIGEDVNTVLKKRWSGINMSSKLFTAYNRLAHENSEEEYTDSLETSPPTVISPPKQLENVMKMEEAPESLDSNFSLDEKPLNGKKFKKLQRKWEMLSGKEQSPPDSPTHGNKSKIPRPVSSPSSRPSGIPVPVSPTKKTAPTVKKAVTPPGINKQTKFAPKPSPAKKTTPSRTSRLDQLEDSPQKHHPARPSSLPYKPAAAERGKAGKITPPRRAVSTSVNRKPLAGHPTPKVVRTLSHRLPTESGHLSYNEGERLKVVLEVDERWLLCCRGTQKGLVPRDAVIADSGRF